MAMLCSTYVKGVKEVKEVKEVNTSLRRLCLHQQTPDCISSLRQSVFGEIAKTPCDLDVCIQLGQRRYRDGHESCEFFGAREGCAFRYVGGHRDGGSPHLHSEAKYLFLGKRSAYPIDMFD
jgi:hypothetical protein